MCIGAGDVVKAVDASISGITSEREYKVLRAYKDSGDGNRGYIKIKDDDGEIKNYYERRFLKVKGMKIMETLKEYFGKHKDTFITVAMVILVDEFLLGGSLRVRVKKLCNSILTTAEKKLNGGTE